MARILIAGCGYVGSALGERLLADSHEVFGLRRRPAALPEGIRLIEADLAVAGSLRDLPGGIDKVVYAAGPGGRDDAFYRTAYVEGLGRLLEALEQQAQRPERVIFVSSTSVYAQTNGGWVDETSETVPRAHNGRRLLEAEALLRAAPFLSVVVRFGGIYGPRRTRLIDRVRTGQAIYQQGVTRYTNRIHRDDCAGMLHHLLFLDSPEDLYLGVDNDPAEDVEVMRFLAGALGAAEPRVAHGKDRARAGGSNKRCRNQRLLDSGYSFQYPTFREGYAEVIRGLH
jgi:nucleoside-diphosphate-sugar epimerase